MLDREQLWACAGERHDARLRRARHGDLRPPATASPKSRLTVLAIWSEVRAAVRTESAQLDNSGGTDVPSHWNCSEEFWRRACSELELATSARRILIHGPFR